MAQTERDSTTILGLLADNTSGEISPTDLRDAFASHMGYGCMILKSSSAPKTLTAVGTVFKLINSTVYTDITCQSSDVNINGTTASLANGSFTLGVAGIYQVNFSGSFTASANNLVLTFSLFVDGIQGDIQVSRYISAGADTGVISLTGLLPFSAGKILDIRVKRAILTTSVIFQGASFYVHRVD